MQSAIHNGRKAPLCYGNRIVLQAKANAPTTKLPRQSQSEYPKREKLYYMSQVCERRNDFSSDKQFSTSEKKNA